MANFLVTGAAGFIGCNIVRDLLERGHSVRGIDNFITGSPENIEEVKDKFEFIEGDIRDMDTMMEVTRDMDYVLHQAALRSVPRSLDNPLLSNETNVAGTLTVLQAVRENKVKRMVYASSSSTYGDQPTKYKVETQCPAPLSPYAVSKLGGELYCKAFNVCFGIETVCMRYFNVFGPHQDPKSKYSAVIPLFIHAIANDVRPVIYGDGSQSRDFTYVKNVCSANFLAATTEGVGNGEVFNVACGTSWNLHQILDSVKKWENKPDIEPRYTPPRTGDFLHSMADISKAKELLGYEVLIPFEEGLKYTYDWFKKNPYPFDGMPWDKEGIEK